MNYKLHYDLLISKAESRLLEEQYYEIHHIIPRCLGGLDNDDNLIKLTAKEHYIAHMLLAKIYSGTQYGYKLASAFNYMCVDSHGGNRTRSRGYALARLLFSKNHPTKNPEVIDKIKASLKIYWDNKKLTYQYIEYLCPCGCETKLKIKIGHKLKFVKGHENINRIHIDTSNYSKALIKRYENDDERLKQSNNLKNYISTLSKEEKSVRSKNSFGNCDQIARALAISESKRGKKTNQQELEILKYGQMSAKEFNNFLIGRSKTVITRSINKRKIYLDRINNK